MPTAVLRTPRVGNREDVAAIQAETLTTTLDRGTIGSSYEVEYLDLPLATAHRLETLGMTPGTVVEVLNNKSAGTVIIRLRETRYALGRGITSGIHVKSSSGPAMPGGAS